MPEKISPYGSLPAREQPVKFIPNDPRADSRASVG
jgi:hypothetical protein